MQKGRVKTGIATRMYIRRGENGKPTSKPRSHDRDTAKQLNKEHEGSNLRKA